MAALIVAILISFVLF